MTDRNVRPTSNRCLAVRQQPQQSIDSQMQYQVRDDGDDNRHHQGVPAASARTGDDTAKRHVERIARRYYELHKRGSATSSEQSQQEAQPEQSVNDKEDIIDNLRDARQASRALDLTLGIDYFVDRL